MCYILIFSILRLFCVVNFLGVHGSRRFRLQSLSPELHGPKWLGIELRPKSEWFGVMHMQYHAPELVPVPAEGPVVDTSAPCLDSKRDLQCSKGVFVLLHACQHHSGDFFTLPEETTITTAVVRRGFVALVPDAPNRPTRCWAPYEDGLVLHTSINLFLEGKGLKDKPLYGIGISSGGVMLAKLISSYKMPFLGSHYVVSPGAANALTDDPGPGAFATHDFPRSTFVYMKEDYYAPPVAIKVAARELKKRGTDVLVLESKPKQVWNLMKRAGLMNIHKDVMQRIIQQLYSWGYLESRCKGCPADEVSSFHEMLSLWLKQSYSDGAATRLYRNPSFSGYLKEDMVRARALLEELHYIEAVHGPTAEHIEVVMQFLLVGERPD